MIPLLWLGCSAMQTEGETFVVRSEGADLPVWVRGDQGSGDFIVWLAGGPGDPAAIVRGEATEIIEDDHAMVYWDQRGAGSAGGNAAPESFTLDQYVEDTDAVIDVIRERYDPERIFLLGHSWGGTLGTAYLLDDAREAKVAGWLDVAGNHDHPLVFPMKIDWLERYALDAIAQGRDVDHWSEVRHWCATEPAITVETFERWNGYLDGTDAVFHDPDVSYDVGFEMLFLSGESPLAYFAVNDGYAAESLYADDEVFQTLSFTDEMDRITVPTALFWGRYDGIVPMAAADAARAALVSAEVTDVVFERSGHFSFLEEPEAFAAAVGSFVDGI